MFPDNVERFIQSSDTDGCAGLVEPHGDEVVVLAADFDRLLAMYREATKSPDHSGRLQCALDGIDYETREPLEPCLRATISFSI